VHPVSDGDRIAAAAAGLLEGPAAVATPGTSSRRARNLVVPTIRRVASALVTTFVVISVVFFITHAIGDPATLMLPSDASESQVTALRQMLGLDRPVIEQYVSAAGGWIRGDFGLSLVQGVPALPLVIAATLKTLYLTAVAVLFAVPLALALGTVAGFRPGSIVDKLVTGIASVGVSVPSFWIGLILILTFAVSWRVLPSNGFGGLPYAILPAIAVGLKPLGTIAQMTRAAVGTEVGKKYVVAARARGVSETRIAVGHVLKNAAAPIVTIIGMEIGSLINGVVVVETVFAWPGIGHTLINAINTRDLPMVQACVAVVAAMVIIVNLAVDTMYSIMDPRVRR
jgi:peptide/nickel transport system permease protein